MRQLVDAERIHGFMEALGTEARAAADVYLTGGTTAVLFGWRATSVDVDLKIVPEHDELLRALPRLKESLHINIELVAPSDFIPVRDDWAERSPFVAQAGRLTFRHFDLCAQALAKIERGHASDVADVRAMLDRQLVTRAALREYFRAIAPGLYRYPALDPASFEAAVMAVANA